MNDSRSSLTSSVLQSGLLKKVSASRRLAKFPLCLLIACSAALGGSLAPAATPGDVAAVAVGVLLLAMGAATLNSLQEVKVDGSMRRTQNRPLVRGELTKGFALVQTWLLVACGIVVIQITAQSLIPPTLGLLGLLLYNGCYTPLKKRTLLAMVPGAICGAIPPMIGLSAVGESLISHKALLLSTLLILWQIPHFFLVQLQHKHDYLNSVQPSFLRELSEQTLRKVSVVWVMALGFVMLLVSVSPLVSSPTQSVAIVVSALAFTVWISQRLLDNSVCNYKTLFVSLNVMLVVHMLILLF